MPDAKHAVHWEHLPYPLGLADEREPVVIRTRPIEDRRVVRVAIDVSMTLLERSIDRQGFLDAVVRDLKDVLVQHARMELDVQTTGIVHELRHNIADEVKSQIKAAVKEALANRIEDIVEQVVENL